jgi:hydroxymethylglutaryl-CoA lyase
MTDDKDASVVITDVTLREYGQNVPARFLYIFTPEIRHEIALGLIDAGFTTIEVLSCIHPGIAPAMSRDLLEKTVRKIGRRDGVRFVTLVPNRAGYETFLDLGLGPDGYGHTMALFFSAVEAHNLANLGRPIKDTLDEYRIILKDASSRGIRTVAYISAAFGYLAPEGGGLLIPDTGALDEYIDLMFGLGSDLVTLSDLQGVASEEATAEMLEGILRGRTPREIGRLGYHPHHVSGEKAIANSKVAYERGIRRFDASLGGTGGCVTGAPGNQPTEGLIRLLHSLGAETGINEQKVNALAGMVQQELYARITLLESR